MVPLPRVPKSPHPANRSSGVTPHLAWKERGARLLGSCCQLFVVLYLPRATRLNTDPQGGRAGGNRGRTPPPVSATPCALTLPLGGGRVRGGRGRGRMGARGTCSLVRPWRRCSHLKVGRPRFKAHHVEATLQAVRDQRGGQPDPRGGRRRQGSWCQQAAHVDWSSPASRQFLEYEISSRFRRKPFSPTLAQ
jgi:hypothetical protein